MERSTILLAFIFNYSLPYTLNEEVMKKTDLRKSSGVEKIFIHQYSLFNGRFNIPSTAAELRYNNVQTVVPKFLFESGQWKCLRLDNCGLFEIVEINKLDFDNLHMDEQIKFQNESPHLTTYRLTKLYKDNLESFLVSGTQLRNEHTATIKTFQKISRVIRAA